jgi:hypothetical protein
MCATNFLIAINSTPVVFTHNTKGQLIMNVQGQVSKDYPCDKLLSNPELPDETRRAIIKAIEVLGLERK